MRSNLFRDEVLSAHQSGWIGSIRVQAPRPGWLSFGFGLLTILTILVLLIDGHYSRHEQVDGNLVPSGGLITLLPVSPGVVVRIMVKEGEDVKAGQPLIEISGELNSASLGDTQAAIAAQLEIKHERLQADLLEQQRLTLLQQQSLQTRLAALRSQRSQLDIQIAIQTKLANNAMALYKEWSKYVSLGFVSQLEVTQKQDIALQDQAQVKELQEHHFQLEQQTEDLQGQLNQLRPASASKRNDTVRQLADVAQSLSQNAALQGLILRAPADGTIATTMVQPGQFVTAQQALLTILPKTSHLLAELWIAPKAVGFIHQGEAVIIRYQAYPYQKFGQHLGHVEEISRNALSSTEVSRLLGKDIKEPRYRIRVTLDSQQVLAYGKAEALKPGMTLDADILLDRRRIIEWILDPLAGFTTRLKGQVVKSQGSMNG